MTKVIAILFLSFATLALECPKGFLCGSGCGLHESEADSAARAQIAKMFSTKVTSQFSTVRSTLGELDESYVHEAIEENITGELEGVTIQDRKVEEGEVCAQAALNIALFTKRIRYKTEQLESNSQKLKKSKKRLVWEKIRANNVEINHLNSLLLAVDIPKSPGFIEPPVSYKRIKLALKFDVDEGLEDLKKLIDSRLKRNGIFSAKKEALSLSVNLNLKKSSLNVAGFEKYILQYELVTKRKSLNLGRSFGKITRHGRNKEKIIEKMYQDFVKVLPEIFIELKI